MKLIKSFCMSRHTTPPAKIENSVVGTFLAMFVFGKRIIQNKNKIIFGLNVFGSMCVRQSLRCWVLVLAHNTDRLSLTLSVENRESICAFDVDVWWEFTNYVCYLVDIGIVSHKHRHVELSFYLVWLMCDLTEILLLDINYAKGIRNDYSDERVRIFIFWRKKEKSNT